MWALLTPSGPKSSDRAARGLPVHACMHAAGLGRAPAARVSSWSADREGKDERALSGGVPARRKNRLRSQREAQGRGGAGLASPGPGAAGGEAEAAPASGDARRVDGPGTRMRTRASARCARSARPTASGSRVRGGSPAGSAGSSRSPPSPRGADDPGVAHACAGYVGPRRLRAGFRRRLGRACAVGTRRARRSARRA